MVCCRNPHIAAEESEGDGRNRINQQARPKNEQKHTQLSQPNPHEERISQQKKGPEERTGRPQRPGSNGVHVEA